MYDFDKIIDRRNTGAAKWDGGGHGNLPVYPESLSFTIADMEFALPDCIIKAVEKRLEHPILGYTRALTDEYVSCVVDWYAKRYGWRLRPNEIFTSHGVIDGFNRCIQALCATDERVIIQTPAYPPFFGVKRELVYNPLRLVSGRYELDFDHLEQLCADPKNTVLLLCNPHNPTGRVFSDFELIKIAEMCVRHGVAIVCDEIHGDLTRCDTHFTPIMRICPDSDIVSCVSPSKTFNLAGLDTAHIIVNDEMRSRMGFESGFSIGNPLSLAAIMGAYTDEGAIWLDNLRAYLDGNFAYLKRRLDEELPVLEYRIPEGTYLAWINFRRYMHETRGFAMQCAEYGKVLVEEGEVFGGGGSIRVNVACPRKMLKEGIDRIIETLKHYYTGGRFL